MPNPEPVTTAIEQFLAHHSLPNKSFIIALSGGADSVALLHALSQQINPQFLQAIYIDHQLQPDSAQWAEVNRALCQSLGVDFVAKKVDVNRDEPSLENAARVARYAAFSEALGDGQYLLTGHHQDDQAETLLLQLFRGAGPKGLSSMPRVASFAQGFHARPLLSVSKYNILEYCQARDLNVIDDPSNQDTKHRRNFLRHEVFPLVEKEWPQIKQTLTRVSELQASTQQLVEEVATQDFERCWEQGKGLSVESLAQLSVTRQGNLVRHWLDTLGVEMPSFKVLEQILKQLVMSTQDAQPAIDFADGVIRRYDGCLVFTRGGSELSFAAKPWDGRDDLKLTNNVILSCLWLQNHYPELVGEPLTVSLRQGGERFRKPNAKHTTSLKNYLQEMKMPVWQRDQLVLIQLDGEVRAVYSDHLKDLI